MVQFFYINFWSTETNSFYSYPNRWIKNMSVSRSKIKNPLIFYYPIPDFLGNRIWLWNSYPTSPKSDSLLPDLFSIPDFLSPLQTLQHYVFKNNKIIPKLVQFLIINFWSTETTPYTHMSTIMLFSTHIVAVEIK